MQTTPTLCASHGPQPETFVCGHIAESLKTGHPVGFFWSSEDTSEFPDAWCSECNGRLAASGWEWTPETESLAHIKLMCGRCYVQARELNLGAGE